MPSGARSISCTNSSVSGALEATNRFAVIGPAIAVGSSKRVDSSTSSGPVGLVTSPPVFDAGLVRVGLAARAVDPGRRAGLDRAAVERELRRRRSTYASVKRVWPSGKPSDAISPTALPAALVAEDHARGRGGPSRGAEHRREVGRRRSSNPRSARRAGRAASSPSTRSRSLQHVLLGLRAVLAVDQHEPLGDAGGQVVEHVRRPARAGLLVLVGGRDVDRHLDAVDAC